MRGFLVLAGMVVAAAAAVLIWLDATGQLRPWLNTSPQIVFQLDPAPAAASTDPVEAATIANAVEPEAPADADAPADAAGTTSGVDAASADDDATATAGDGAQTSSPEPQLAADFGEGAIALSDVPIATGDGDTKVDAEAGGDSEPIAEPATTDSEPDAAADVEPVSSDDSGDASASDANASDADGGAVDSGDTPDDASAEADSDVSELEPVETADNADAAEAIVVADDTAAPATAEAADPDTVQTAALPILPTDPNFPWRLYAAPFADGDPRPRIAIVFVSLGLSDGATEAIIQQLPGAVTLAFSPYSRKLPDWISRARAKGHEVLVELPMEPLNYPDDDPGPLALLDDRPIEDNVTRLGGILDRAEGAVGVAAQMGSRFTGDEALIGPILEALGQRGFLYVDNGTSPASVVPALSQRIAVPIVINDHYLDTEASRIAIDGRLQQIERIARSEGAAVAFAMPYPITIERLLAWIPTLEAKGFVLAPATAVVGHQGLP
jgi:polysaccharide deacetylase 2 family uncharacterized protein YibQ